jgi:hypothetical protein
MCAGVAPPGALWVVEPCSTCLRAALPCPARPRAAELPDVRTSTPIASVTRDPKKRAVTLLTASGQKHT